MLFTNRKQFENWSLPSKVGYVGFWLGVIGLLISIATSIPFARQLFEPSRENIKLEVAKLLKHKKIGDLDDLLKSIERREDTKDIYYFGKGTAVILNNASGVIEPNYFFRKINIDSELMESAVQNERAYYSTKYAGNNKQTYYSKTGVMLDELSVAGWQTPLYFAFRMMVYSGQGASFKTFSDLSSEFDTRYLKYIDQSTYDGIKVGNIGDQATNFNINMDASSFVFIPEVAFFIALEMLKHSDATCEVKKRSLNILRTAIDVRQSRGRPSIVKTLGQNFSIRYHEDDVKSLIQYHSLLQKNCK